MIAATDIKASEGKVEADNINVKLMLSVALLPQYCHTWLRIINLMLILSTCLHPMEISSSNNMFGLTDLHDDKPITDEFPFS